MTDSESQVWTVDDVSKKINESVNYGLGREEKILNKIENADPQIFSSINNSKSNNIPDCITEEKIRNVLEHYSNNGKKKIDKLAKTIVQDWSMTPNASYNTNSENKVMADGGVLDLSDSGKRLYYLSLSVVNASVVGYNFGSGYYMASAVVAVILAFCIVMYLVNTDYDIDVSIER